METKLELVVENREIWVDGNPFHRKTFNADGTPGMEVWEEPDPMTYFMTDEEREAYEAEIEARENSESTGNVIEPAFWQLPTYLKRYDAPCLHGKVGSASIAACIWWTEKTYPEQSERIIAESFPAGTWTKPEAGRSFTVI